MFRCWRKSSQIISETKIPTETSSIPKYAKPKILLIDVDNRCTEVLRDGGYNVAVGTFGTPYRVKRSNDLNFVSLSSLRLPRDYEEQEIVLVNILAPDPASSPPTDTLGEGVEAIWQAGTTGLIDPRPLAMRFVQNAFDKILNRGGIFIVFAAAREEIPYYYGTAYRLRYGQCTPERHSNWDFLKELTCLRVENHYGCEIMFEPELRKLTAIFSRAQEGAEYHCTLSPAYHQRDYWIPLAKNKYGEDVAGILLYKNSKGCIIILPQMPGAHRFIVQLLEDWCSQWNPALFPYLESSRWVHWPEYEIPKVVELRKEIERVKVEAEEKVKSLQAEIETLQNENADWYTLLRGTGDELVRAVIRSLERLGFQKVVDVDAEAKREVKKSKREDIQIHDRSPVLIIDVKGVQGCPDDDESRQAEKHAIMRMREWNRTDVQPLTIINHQRHLPPRERDEKAFRDEIIRYAEEVKLGLMTTWDLFRLLRNAEILGWPAEVIQPIFYRTGRIEPIPEHYKEIGKIAKLWKHAFGIIPTIPISVGDHLAIEIDDTFLEFSVESLQVDDETVQTAAAGSKCGVKFHSSSKKVREGARVFLVSDVASNREEPAETRRVTSNNTSS